VSYDLVFWKQVPARSEDPRAVYESLATNEPSATVIEFPVEDFLTAVVSSFAGSVREPNGAGERIVWENPDGKGMFEIEWSPRHIQVGLRPLDGDTANRIIDIAAGLGAPLYDPQNDERFDSHLAS